MPEQWPMPGLPHVRLIQRPTQKPGRGGAQPGGSAKGRLVWVVADGAIVEIHGRTLHAGERVFPREVGQDGMRALQEHHAIRQITLPELLTLEREGNQQ